MLELEDVKFLTKLKKCPMISKLIKVGASLALCSVLSSCEPPKNPEFSPENPWILKDTTLIVPWWFSYSTRIYEFSKEPPTSQYKR